MTGIAKRASGISKSSSAAASKPIQALDPDFVISIAYPIEKDSGVAKKNLEIILDSLYHHGFFAQVRPQDATNLLIFVKLGSSAYSEAVAKDSMRDYEFGVTSPSTSAAPPDRLRIVYQVLTHPESIGGADIEGYKFVNSVIPVNSSLGSSSTPTTSATVVTKHSAVEIFKSNASIDSIKNVFGTKVAFYFEFLKYYIAWLTIIASFGVVSTLKSRNRFSMTYTFLNLLWGILFISFWNRREKYLSNSWGVENSSLVEKNILKSSISTIPTLSNADGIRFLKQFAFVPIALLFVATLVTYQLGCFVLEIFLSEIYDGPGKSLLTLLPTVLISVFVPILTIIYNKVSDAHVAWENHDNRYSKKNSNIIKQFALNFLTGYMPLLITSFVYLPFAHLIKPNLGDIELSITSTMENAFGPHHGGRLHRYFAKLKKQEDFKYNQERLNGQFFYFIVTNQVIQLVLKYGLPFIIKFVMKIVNEKILKKDVEEKVVFQDRDDESEFLESVRESLKLPEYNVDDDFRSLILQYGYLIIFGPVWSLAPLVSIIFNVATSKLDLFKLQSGKYFRPPVPARSDSIHPWKYALFCLTWIGSIVSPIITQFYRHGTTPPLPLTESDGPLDAIKASVDDAMGIDGESQPGHRGPHRGRKHKKGPKKNFFEQACVNGSCSSFISLFFLSEHLFFLSYFVIAKFSQLYKSDIELKNDSTATDTKLRREFYSSKQRSKKNDEKLLAEPGVHEGLWEQYGLDNALKQADELKLREKESADSEKDEFQFSNSASSKEALNKVKDDDDSVIQVRDGRGGYSYATIDNNKHFEPPVSVSTPKPPQHQPPAVPTVPQSASSQKSGSEQSEGISSSSTDAAIYQSFVESAERKSTDLSESKADTTVNTADEEIGSADVKIGRKKSALKKLLSKKKQLTRED
ncbi:hypothetical protein CLIB1423_16S02696 [[Candida] railenensis]|uniref:Ist2p n=1 Tax=[Candida] railenensis TaxID=45579 RepID=A0A9P0VZY9_9ASCO|nr:hypothetical protein CLIB1423_16S02696 [[Candida] railenensis]